VSIRYDQTLFRVLDRSGRLLQKVTVDEGMTDLLVAVWKHGPPDHAGEEMAKRLGYVSSRPEMQFISVNWFRIFQVRSGVSAKNPTISHSRQKNIEKIVEELNKNITQLTTKLVQLNNEHDLNNLSDCTKFNIFLDIYLYLKVTNIYQSR
jgi:hypothetical protein